MTRPQLFPPTSRPLTASARASMRFHLAEPPPWTIRATFWVIVADCALILMNYLHRLLTTDWGAWVASQVHSFVRNGHRLEVTPEIAIGTAVFEGVFVLGLVAFELFVAFRMIRGYRWPRIAFSLVAATALVGLTTADVTRTLAAGGWLQGAIPLLLDLACAICAVLVWLPVSTAFIRRATGARRAFKASLLHVR